MVRADRIPPTLLVLVAVSSVQFGGAFAKTLFDEIGPAGTAFLRVLFAALILAALWRPALTGRSRADWRLIASYGVALVAMNLSFYEALDRIPLGIAVTFEFVGPLGVAVAGSRRPLDLVWVALAAAGIVLLSDFGTADLDPLGVGLALLAGCFWAAYILLAARVGRAYPGGQGLALGMAVGALLVAPVGVADAGGDLIGVEALAIGLAVAILS
jgi:inner membrane transporter RhtA